MLSLDTQLSILIHLARADHSVSPEELNIIKKTGQENGLNTTQIEALIASPKSIGDLHLLPKEEKLECLILLINTISMKLRISKTDLSICYQG